jgi:pimeloyl-ACP methyl ester carboxylesterase
MTDARRPIPLALLLALALGAVPARAADRCGQGASAQQDAADIRGVRAQIEVACPCATFDASTPATNHTSFVRCARAVVLDASDGTPVGGRVTLRRQCRGTVFGTVRRSDCGFAPAEDRVPCCTHAVASGRNRGTIRPSASCVSTAGTVKHRCPSFHFAADACSGNALNTCNTVATTTNIASGADAPNTPGTAGVSVINAKLITQFGGTSFSLNNATYTRFRRDGAPAPDAVLILVPGFEGGANDFKILAENLIPRVFLDHGLVLEVWAFDRRGHQLEDRVGLDIAEVSLDPQVALDWLFGAELGLALHPVLVAGPNRRAVFYDQTDVPFIANWTPLVFARDIDAVVSAADAVVQNHNVFLGGHSMGTTFAARYAATDFDLTGSGPPQPGYARLRGLVLLEGGGGSTLGAPLTADTLDRIEAKFDGGLFGAVANPSSTGRCVDGTTECTIANEATDCSGQVPPKCTPPTQAYSTLNIGPINALNPRVLGASEAAAIQGASDPDGGQTIIGVDQGAPGNNALALVPDLAGLSLLPTSTVMGGIGSFVDDDGAISSLAPFVATSVGEAGATVEGVLTWHDVTEGPFSAGVVPDNGPQPTAFPTGVWGQEKEVTNFTRFLTTFYAGGSNFTDWYYPNAGLSVTSVSGRCSSTSGGTCTVGNVGASCAGANQAQADAQCSQAISLDSTALSVGRGRRDIENLTEAANVDIPVIAFGGTNGLARAPGAWVPFGKSIKRCGAPSCDQTTDRVVDETTPSPAFPTLGGVPGGFEVHMNEGHAHVDVLTAEEGPDNNVIGPLGAFLRRNVQ